MQSQIVLTIIGFKNKVDGLDKAVEFKLSNNEIDSFSFDFDSTNYLNAKSAMDHRLIKIIGGIEDVLEKTEIICTCCGAGPSTALNTSGMGKAKHTRMISTNR